MDYPKPEYIRIAGLYPSQKAMVKMLTVEERKAFLVAAARLKWQEMNKPNGENEWEANLRNGAVKLEPMNV